MVRVDIFPSGNWSLQHKKYEECQPTLDLLGIEKGRINEERAFTICREIMAEEEEFFGLPIPELSEAFSKPDRFGLDVTLRFGRQLTGIQIKSSGYEYFNFYKIHKDRKLIPCVVVNRDLPDADVRPALILAIRAAVKKRGAIHSNYQKYLRTRGKK